MATTNKDNKAFHVAHEGEAVEDLFSGIETPAEKPQIHYETIPCTSGFCRGGIQTGTQDPAS